jgi:TolA-binding protein
MKMVSMLVLGALCGAVLVATVQAQPAAAAPAAATAKAEPTLADVQRQVADAVTSINAQLKELQTRVDSISKFLGDRQASSMDTVDRRLRDLERDLDDLDRKVDRIR